MRMLPNIRGARDEGFTLLELLVVLAIVSTTTAVIVTLARPSSAILEPRRTALEMAAHLRAARTRAIETNTEATFTLDADGRAFWTSLAERRHAMPQTLAVAMTSAQFRAPEPGRGHIRYFPDGSSTGGTVTLEAEGRRVTLDVDWLTGAARITDAHR